MNELNQVEGYSAVKPPYTGSLEAHLAKSLSHFRSNDSIPRTLCRLVSSQAVKIIKSATIILDIFIVCDQHEMV